MFKTGALHHIELYVSNLEKSSRFYNQILSPLGYEKQVCGNVANFVLKASHYICLVQTEKEFQDKHYHRKQTGLNHLAFHVGGFQELFQFLFTLNNQGIDLIYKNIAPFFVFESYLGFFIEDPDRIKLEFAYNLTKNPELESENFLLGLFNPAEHNLFSIIEEQYTDGSEQYMQTEAYKAFQLMYKAAQEDGIELKIISATRNFFKQKTIWDNKFNGKRLVEGENLAELPISEEEKALKILRYSALPGTSRHHWGTDIDINCDEPEYWETSQGVLEFNWLTKNAEKFGYYNVYNSKQLGRTGYEEEKWHWSYLPIAKQLLLSFSEKINNKQLNILNNMNTEIDFIGFYVKGILGEISL